jgi:SAM-dependent methyltransferase
LAGVGRVGAAASAAVERREILGVPHFHQSGALPLLNLLETQPTHPYSDSAQRVIDDIPKTGIFLDFGCGVKAPDDIRANAVLLDAVHFPGVDVVNSCTTLPFRSEVFDAIVSQAVFEHLPYPHQTAAQCLRVLKPGGLFLVDTAFLQPLHADPSHYFNMTSDALRLVLDGFEIIDEGSRFYQYPSYSLKMQIDEVLPYVRRGRWLQRLEQLRAELDAGGADLDDDLGPIGRRILAGGVYALARKPLR